MKRKLINKFKCKQKHLYRFIRGVLKSERPAFYYQVRYTDGTLVYLKEDGYRNGIYNERAKTILDITGLTSVGMPFGPFRR